MVQHIHQQECETDAVPQYENLLAESAHAIKEIERGCATSGRLSPGLLDSVEAKDPDALFRAAVIYLRGAVVARDESRAGELMAAAKCHGFIGDTERLISDLQGLAGPFEKAPTRRDNFAPLDQLARETVDGERILALMRELNFSPRWTRHVLSFLHDPAGASVSLSAEQLSSLCTMCSGVVTAALEESKFLPKNVRELNFAAALRQAAHYLSRDHRFSVQTRLQRLAARGLEHLSRG